MAEETHFAEEPLLHDRDRGRSGETNHGDNITPYSNANFLSILTFSWMGPLLSVGSRKRLNPNDIPKLADDDRANGVFSNFEEKLRLCSNNGSINSNTAIGSLRLSKALLISVWRHVLLSILFAVTCTTAEFVGPYLLDALVKYLNIRHEASAEGYVLVSVFLFAKLIECILQRHWFFRAQLVGMRCQAALVAMIYKKGLTLSNRSRQESGSGEIVNFMSVDAGRIGDFCWYMIDLCLIPLQFGLALAILYKKLGVASAVALLATLAVMVTNLPFSKLEQNFQDKMMESKDKRLKATLETLRNMRILKLYGWEMRFLSKIVELRKDEMSWLRKFLYTEVIVTFVYWGAPIFVSVVTFLSCILMGIPLESGKVLSALATFGILKDPIYNLPDAISMLAQAVVSLERISMFLSLEDWQPNIVEKLPEGSSEVAIEVSNGYFSWDLLSANPTLKDVNLRITHGMRVAICGTVGSGKSSLLACILGEIPKISGTVKLCGNKAYVSQSPWIQSGTIESNILFGKEMNREKYECVLEACSLKKDLEILPFGDKTIIGERGINLSGGQKQRVQIARSLYQDANIYLFDDPFSAVDAHTGNHLFQECLLGLLGSKTVIYVTHQVEFLSSADMILVMMDGKITQAGKYNDILSIGSEFTELVSAHNKTLSALDTSKMLLLDSQAGSKKSFFDSFEDGSHVLGSSEWETWKEEKYDEQSGTVSGQLIQEEERQTGKVGLSVYWKYITALHKGVFVPFILLAQLLFEILQIGSNYWMAIAAPVSRDTRAPVSGSILILVYVSLAIASSFCILIRASLLATTGYKTATLLFNKMHTCIFRAPMLFFDATPSGRILNRASTDQSAVDESIPFQMGVCASSIIQLLGIIIVMSQVAWEVFVIFIIVTAICVCYQKYYIATARELTRLMGVQEAPVIQHFSESISGLTTIRNFNQESRFMHINLQLLDAYLQPKFHNAGATEWLCFRLDILSSMTFAFCLAFLIFMPPGAIDPGTAGVAITYGLNLSSLLALVIWNICNLENKIISVERILQYTCIPSEPPLVVKANHPMSNWPSQGEINIINLQIRYAPHLPLVLRGLTCSFHGGRKTGIVGRTGSGKSTLVQALFRIMEPTDGRIVIDEIDISTIGLLDLRPRLSIIPQEPTMFEGTVRSNLDPLEEYTDKQIWEALEKCQLGEDIRRKEKRLDTPVAENGENWSIGQRQLICLGRVLLKKSKVLVLDEATSSVDTVTDDLIQRVLETHFSDSTVIMIAHRIVSVLDSDMILLLDNGQAIEYDSPAKLLDNKLSAFSKLVNEYISRPSTK